MLGYYKRQLHFDKEVESQSREVCWAGPEGHLAIGPRSPGSLSAQGPDLVELSPSSLWP